MHLLIPFIEQFVIDAIMGSKPVASPKNKFGLGLAALSGFLFMLTLFFISLFAYNELQAYYTQPQAALLMAAAIFILGVCTSLSAYLLFKKKTKHNTVRRKHLSDIIYQVGEMIGEEIDGPIRDNPKTAMILASLAGFVAGDKLS